MRPHRWQPTRLPHPWDSPGNNTRVGCHFLLQCMKVKSESEVAQSCPTLSDPMDCSLPGSSIHGIFWARVLEWGAIAFSKRNLTVYPNFHSGSGVKLVPVSRYKGTMEDQISCSACAVSLLPWQSPHMIRSLRILAWSGPLPTPHHIFSSSFPDLPSLCPHTNDTRCLFCKCALFIFSFPIKK